MKLGMRSIGKLGLWLALVLVPAPERAGTVVQRHLTGLDRVRLDVEAWAPSHDPRRLPAFEARVKQLAIRDLEEAGISVGDGAPATLSLVARTELVPARGETSKLVAAVFFVSLSEPMTVTRQPGVPIADGGNGVDWLDYRLRVVPEADLESEMENELERILIDFCGEVNMAKRATLSEKSSH